MTNEEKNFEKFFNKIMLDDEPDYTHRDRLEAKLLAALAKVSRHQSKTTNIWRIIMKSKTIKISTAAAVIVLALVATWIFSKPQFTENISSLTLLSQVCAAEQALFKSDNIVHIVNQITVHPSSAYKKSAELLNKLAQTTSQSMKEIQSLNEDFLNSWLVGWLPVCSLKADGQLQTNEIKVPTDHQRKYTILDDIWYDPTMGLFARIMTVDNEVVFANSFDGDFVYISETDSNGILQLTSEPITVDFAIPQNPAEFLGITAGIKNMISEETLRQPIQQVYEDQLEDGTKAHIYKAGFKDTSGDISTYSLFKVRNDNGTIAEIDYVLRGQPQLVIRKVLTESVENPEISWNLSEISQEIAKKDSTGVVVDSGVVAVDISVNDMVEEAGFKTYILATNPSWADPGTIAAVSDPISPPHRMFIIIYKATDGRHVVLVQSHTHNKYFASITKQVQAHGETLDKTTYDNGCKLWLNTGGEKWWTDFTLRCSGFEPAKDRQGYIVETPSGTVVCIAINGPISEQELQSLVDSLVPADEYVRSSVQP